MLSHARMLRCNRSRRRPHVTAKYAHRSVVLRTRFIEFLASDRAAQESIRRWASAAAPCIYQVEKGQINHHLRSRTALPSHPTLKAGQPLVPLRLQIGPEIILPTRSLPLVGSVSALEP